MKSVTAPTDFYVKGPLQLSPPGGWSLNVHVSGAFATASLFNPNRQNLSTLKRRHFFCIPALTSNSPCCCFFTCRLIYSWRRLGWMDGFLTPQTSCCLFPAYMLLCMLFRLRVMITCGWVLPCFHTFTFHRRFFCVSDSVTDSAEKGSGGVCVHLPVGYWM